MAGINFLSRNLVKSSVISLTTGTQNAQFPLSNLLNDSPAIKFRSQESTVVLLFDLLITSTINAVALHGDTNSDLGITSASFKTSLTTDFSSSTPVNIPLNAAERLGFALTEGINHRYLELTLTGGGGFCELSNVFIGERVELEQNNLSISSFNYGLSDNSTVTENDYGQFFVDKRNSTKFISGSIQYCTISEQAVLDEIFTRHQRSIPLWVIVDKNGDTWEDAREKLTVYGYLNSAPIWSANGGNTFSTSIRVKQAG